MTTEKNMLDKKEADYSESRLGRESKCNSQFMLKLLHDKMENKIQ